MEVAFLFMIWLQVVMIVLQVMVFIVHKDTYDKKENEYYTDYVHKNQILRIYKPEFEYQAIGKIDINKILDRGVFSQFYLWALIEK